MKTVVWDFESFYDDTVSLSKLTTQEYITHPEFEVIGVGVQWADGHEPHWATDHHVDAVMETLRKEQDSLIVIGHNNVFDAAIASWHYGVKPAFVVDTLSMARVLGLQSTVGGSLGKLAEQMQRAGVKVPPKGDEVLNAKGKHRKDFTDAELHAYGQYCKTDCKIARALYNELMKLMTIDELMWQSCVLKMYTEPMLRINGTTVANELQRVKDKREASKHRLATALGVSDLNALVSVLNSNPKFAEALSLFGAEAPMKTSPTTGKPTFALGIKDEAFLEMLDHPVDEVRELVVARMGLKSSIEESRCEQFLKLAEFEAMPAPYKISGARTHRLGSADALGLQNLPSGRIKGQSKAMRESIEAPDGHELIGCDASQIEVRTIDYIAGDIQGVEDHRNGVCPYSSVAVQLYGEGTPDQIKRDAKKGIEPWASRRQVSKSARLSLQFGSGAEGFRLYCKTSGVTITAEEAEFYKSGFRWMERCSSTTERALCWVNTYQVSCCQMVYGLHTQSCDLRKVSLDLRM
jgi:hypothetical protein